LIASRPAAVICSQTMVTGRPATIISGVDRLLCGLQDRAAFAHGAESVLQVADAPGEAIDANVGTSQGLD
jgi:hypothetical protein